MECDDVQKPVCKYRSCPPNFPPGQVHIMMWERQAEDSEAAVQYRTLAMKSEILMKLETACTSAACTISSPVASYADVSGIGVETEVVAASTPLASSSDVPVVVSKTEPVGDDNVIQDCVIVKTEVLDGGNVEEDNRVDRMRKRYVCDKSGPRPTQLNFITLCRDPSQWKPHQKLLKLKSTMPPSATCSKSITSPSTVTPVIVKTEESLVISPQQISKKREPTQKPFTSSLPKRDIKSSSEVKFRQLSSTATPSSFVPPCGSLPCDAATSRVAQKFPPAEIISSILCPPKRSGKTSKTFGGYVPRSKQIIEKLCPSALPLSSILESVQPGKKPRVCFALDEVKTEKDLETIKSSTTSTIVRSDVTNSTGVCKVPKGILTSSTRALMMKKEPVLTEASTKTDAGDAKSVNHKETCVQPSHVDVSDQSSTSVCNIIDNLYNELLPFLSDDPTKCVAGNLFSDYSTDVLVGVKEEFGVANGITPSPNVSNNSVGGDTCLNASFGDCDVSIFDNILTDLSNPTVDFDSEWADFGDFQYRY